MMRQGKDIAAFVNIVSIEPLNSNNFNESLAPYFKRDSGGAPKTLCENAL
jgi:hypothetical protein